MKNSGEETTNALKGMDDHNMTEKSDIIDTVSETFKQTYKIMVQGLVSIISRARVE